MDVTIENFNRSVELLEDLIPSCEFIAFDEEMTGISIKGVTSRMDDAIADRYKTMCEVAQTYHIIQIGLCLFHKINNSIDPNISPTYIARPFNFYLFPADGDIWMDADSIHFNKKNNMDFNKWIYQGIPYKTLEDSVELEKKILHLDDDHKRLNMSEVTREADIQFLNQVFETIDKWYNLQKSIPYSDAETLDRLDTLSPQEIQSIIDSRTLLLPDCNSFLRLAIRTHITTTLVDSGDLIIDARHLDGDDSNKWNVKLYILCLSPVMQTFVNQKKMQQKKEKYLKKVGFQRVWQLLLDSKRPMVGHNCFCDLLFLYTHFQAAKLPDTINEFKMTFSKLFPTIFDTKFMVNQSQFMFAPPNNPRFKETHLAALYETLKGETTTMSSSSSPMIAFAAEFQKYANLSSSDDKSHEAAFDAYMTGFIFAHLLKEMKPGDDWSNYFNLYRHPCAINLRVSGGECLNDIFIEPSCAIYKFTDFPKGFKTKDIHDLMTKDGAFDSNHIVKMIWVSSECVFVYVKLTSVKEFEDWKETTTNLHYEKMKEEKEEKTAELVVKVQRYMMG
jgi:poly(A)-specific ribonuclease